MEKIEFIIVDSPAEISRAAKMAETIWTAHYLPIIGPAQVKYMLENFQSEKAIGKQIKEGARYFIISVGARDAGYIAIKPGDNSMYVSKLYISADDRGKGYGRAAIGFIRDISAAKGLHSMTLNVNRNNSASIEAYKKMGFRVIKEVVNDIGSGFVMDDYVMENEF
jgi:ribosomal protein S18 acetylase RimI-like enzyme